MQTDVEVDNTSIVGTLKFIEGGISPSGPLSGDGYFLALNFLDSAFDEFSSVKVGLNPSQGTGLVEIIDDPDKNGVFKITDKDAQVFEIEATTIDGDVIVVDFDISGLELVEE